MKINDIITLDVTELESPLPLHSILRAIENNLENKTILVIHRIEPKGLYPYLQKLGLKYTCRQVESHFEITIKKTI